ncbi:MAG TPA: DUF4214 domain-containing protein [Cellulomonadaceae bacterium]|nr:DUF4214 domain-containing protein [Cellulomonadaceae bacterium]
MTSAQAVVTARPAVTATTSSVPPSAPSTTTKVQQYVTVVYEDLFGRDPDPEGLATWTAALLNGTPRIAVANAITSSDEFGSGL